MKNRALLLCALAALIIGNAAARDLGQWGNSDPAIQLQQQYFLINH